MIVTLKNAEIPALSVLHNQGYLLDQKRMELRFTFDASNALTDLDELFSVENCETILIQDNDTEQLYAGYTVRGELTKKKVQSTDGEGRKVMEDRVFLVMYQRTYEEERITATLNALDGQETINAEQDAALMELCELLMV